MIVVGEFPKLSETFVISHITGLLDLGVDVTILAERMGDTDQWHDDVDNYKLTDRTLWYGLPVSLRTARDHLSSVSANIRHELTDLLEQASILKLPPPLDRLARALSDEQARTETKLRLFHAAEVLTGVRKSFDIVHCHFGHRGLFAAELKRMGVISGKIVVSFHGIDLTEHVAKKGIHVYETLKDHADLSLPVSNFFRERLLRLGMSPRRTHVHHVGIDCQKFSLRERRVVDGEPVRILSAGRLVPKKGIEYAIRAIGLLKERNASPRFHFDILGDGPEQPTLLRLVDKLKLQDQVTFHGACAHDQVRDHMNRSHLFIAPSVTAADGDMEGIPTTIMEAMASGMPVISTQHSGIPELIQDGETGLLCRERDFRQLADRIGFLLANPELWPELGRQGRRTVEADFNTRKQNAKVLNYYEELLTAEGADRADMRAVG
jgi:colanic acid/amylovoran biosynthesis glycosyltransferase